MEPAVPNQRPRSATQVDQFSFQMFSPSVPMPVCENEKQPPNLDAAAGRQEFHHSPRMQTCQALEYPVKALKTRVVRQFIDRFKNRALGARYPYGPAPDMRGPLVIPIPAIRVFNSGRAPAEKSRPMQGYPFRGWQAIDPRRSITVELNPSRRSQVQIVDMASEFQRAFPAQMHIAAHKSLQRDQDRLPGQVVSLRAIWWRTSVHAPDDTLDPPARGVLVDGFWVDAPRLQPCRIDDKPRRERLKQRL